MYTKHNSIILQFQLNNDVCAKWATTIHNDVCNSSYLDKKTTKDGRAQINPANQLLSDVLPPLYYQQDSPPIHLNIFNDMSRYL